MTNVSVTRAKKQKARQILPGVRIPLSPPVFPNAVGVDPVSLPPQLESIMQLAQSIVADLRRIVDEKNVLTSAEDLIPYSFDGTAALQQMPGCVVFAESTAHV